ncbi:hypothetical protein BGW39_007205 [Mortierella sp. 14UC]|nr:hypothetical protein BGW39_007205 [Mortierella sp. 14UC]
MGIAKSSSIGLTTNVSQVLASKRAAVIKDLEQIKDPEKISMRNFIYSISDIQEVLSVDDWSEVAESWGQSWRRTVSEEEIAGIGGLATSITPRTTYQ